MKYHLHLDLYPVILAGTLLFQESFDFLASHKNWRAKKPDDCGFLILDLVLLSSFYASHISSSYSSSLLNLH